MMVVSVLMESIFVLMRFLVFVVDLITFPIFFMLQKPWQVRKYEKSVHAECKVDEEGQVVYTSTIEPCHMNKLIEQNGLRTMTDILDFACKRYGPKSVLGTRAILSSSSEQQPNGKVFTKQILGDYSWQSYDEMRKNALSLSKGLSSDLNLSSGSRLAILAETRADWMITAYACFLNNLTMVTLYPTLGLDGLLSALNETEVRVVVVTAETLQRVQSILEQCQNLEFLLVMPALAPGEDDIITNIGKELNDHVKLVRMNDLREKYVIQDNNKEIEETLIKPGESDTAIIMYTSGSTGRPKGVILSHRNVVSALKAMINYVDFNEKDTCMPLLPLAHVLELTAEAVTMIFGVETAYSSPFTITDMSTKIKRGCKGDASIFKPTMLVAVPLLIERIYKSIFDKMRRAGPIAERIFFAIVNYKRYWLKKGFDTPLINALVFRRIRANIGGRLRAMVTGGAPLSEETHDVIRAILGIDLLQGYGATETTGCATVCSRLDRSTGRVGPPALNVELKLVSWPEGGYCTSDKPFPRGELHVGGANVAMGYFNNDCETENAFYVDQKGQRWFKTSDIGQMDEDGVLRIIDRKNDLIKLTHGEFVSYGKIESVLKTHPLVEQVCVVANSKMDLLIAMIVPEKTLLEELAKMEAEKATKDENVLQKFVNELRDFGLKNGLNKIELPQKVVLSLEEWTPDSGLVTASMKIRRRFVAEHFKEEIKAVDQ